MHGLPGFSPYCKHRLYSAHPYSRAKTILLCLFDSERLIFTFSLVTGTDCVRLIRLAVPSHKFLNDRATLRCLFDLEREQLYSVKWYKDGHEFFRYIPGDQDQTITVFQLPGVKVNVSYCTNYTSYSTSPHISALSEFLK